MVKVVTISAGPETNYVVHKLMGITVFTCIELANLGILVCTLVVGTDGWRLHNDASEKSFLFNKVYKNFP